MSTIRRLVPTALLAAAGLAFGVSPAVARAGEAEGWWEVRSPSFTVLTNSSPERGAEIARDLERFRAVFARLAPEIELRSPVPTRIVAFRDAAAYVPYKTTRDGGGVKTLGQFLTATEGNFLTLNADPEETSALGVAYHEYVHELVRHNFPRVPLWFNEGLAEYYRTFTLEGEDAVIGRPPERHLRWLGKRVELGLDEVLGVTSEKLRHDGAEEVGRLYAVSWALVHYLLSGDPERLDRTADYLGRLAAGEDALGAFEHAFGVRVSRLEEELVGYLRRGELPLALVPLTALPAAAVVEVRPLPPQDAHVHLGDLALRVGRREAAESHYLAALEQEPEHPEALAGLAHLQDLSGSRDEARLLYRDALAAGPGSARTLLFYGRHLLARLAAGGPAEETEELVEEARGVLSQAVVMAPDFAEARALLGRTYLFGSAGAADGVPHLERAREALPLRMDLVFDLIQLQVRAGRFGRAEALVAGVLRPWAEPELVAEAEEVIERGRLLHAADQAFREGETEEALRLFDQAVSVTTDPELRGRMEERLRELQDQAPR